ncbi:MAG: chemotaxis protein CheW, partial [Gammaproteobacteria bacterium]|nr:chemotaxis protein CheW [Gammaproteobacteria bacterium]
PLVTPLLAVAEIITPPTVASVPGVKPWVMGIANMRGTLLPIMQIQRNAAHGCRRRNAGRGTRNKCPGRDARSSGQARQRCERCRRASRRYRGRGRTSPSAAHGQCGGAQRSGAGQGRHRDVYRRAGGQDADRGCDRATKLHHGCYEHGASRRRAGAARVHLRICVHTPAGGAGPAR